MRQATSVKPQYVVLISINSAWTFGELAKIAALDRTSSIVLGANRHDAMAHSTLDTELGPPAAGGGMAL